MRKDNNYVEMLCVVNVSSTCRQRVVEDCQKDVRTGRRRCAVSWRKRALEWKDKGRKKGTQKRDVFTFKHKSDSTASRFGMKTGLADRGVDPFVSIARNEISPNQMCIQSK